MGDAPPVHSDFIFHVNVKHTPRNTKRKDKATSVSLLLRLPDLSACRLCSAVPPKFPIFKKGGGRLSCVRSCYTRGQDQRLANSLRPAAAAGTQPERAWRRVAKHPWVQKKRNQKRETPSCASHKSWRPACACKISEIICRWSQGLVPPWLASLHARKSRV